MDVGSRGGKLEPTRLMVLDVKRAFLYGRMKRRVYIRLPPEDPRSREPGILGRLERAMYGCRDAPQIWQGEVRRALCALGFRPSIGQPSVYFHDDRRLQVVVHVDDFLFHGSRGNLEWVYQELAKEFQLKRQVLGPGRDEHQQVTFLGRSLQWTEGGDLV